jgi:hypothetical protein
MQLQLVKTIMLYLLKNSTDELIQGQITATDISVMYSYV